MTYKPEFFTIQELVPQHVYDDRRDRAWELLDENMLITLDELRRAFGPITVNNWHKGKEREWSGLRTDQSPYGTIYSQHRFGRAADCIFHDTNIDVVRDVILAAESRFPLINSVELETSWLHFDVRNCERIKTYRP